MAVKRSYLALALYRAQLDEVAAAPRLFGAVASSGLSAVSGRGVRLDWAVVLVDGLRIGDEGFGRVNVRLVSSDFIFVL